MDYESEKYKAARLHYLSQFLFGESMAKDYCVAMAEFAPTPEAKNALLSQADDEARHTELLTEFVRNLPNKPSPAVPHLLNLHAIMEQHLANRDWARTLFIQNFIIEGIALTLFREQRKHGDALTRDLFDQIIRDEDRHVAFGVSELSKIVTGNPTLKRQLFTLQRRTLYHSLMVFKDLARDAGELGMKWNDLAHSVITEHMARVQQAGLGMPVLDRLALRMTAALL